MRRAVIAAAYLGLTLFALLILHFLGGQIGEHSSIRNTLEIAVGTPVYGLHLLKGESIAFGSLALALTALMLVGVTYSIIRPGSRSILVGGLGLAGYWLLTIFFLLIHV